MTPAGSIVRLRFACREVALCSNPAASASTIGWCPRQLSAELGLGHLPSFRSRLDEVDANVSRRATSGFAWRRHAHTSAHDRSRWRFDRRDRISQCSCHCRGRLASIRHIGTCAGSRVARGGRPQAAQRAYRGIFERASTCGLPRDGPRVGARWSRWATRRMGARRHLVAPHGGPNAQTDARQEHRHTTSKCKLP